MSTANLPSKEKIREKYDSYYNYFQDIINAIVDKLQNNVTLMAQPTYKSRVKSFGSYYKKVLRLKSHLINSENKMIYLTDMMGIRLICAFLEDINIAIEQIKNIFDVEEIEVKGADKKFSEFGYESVHVLVKIPNEIKEAAEAKHPELDKLNDTLVCEIQVRTILQDAWAEVEHELIYKTEFNPFDIPLRRKLASLNASLTLADITFQEIRDYQNKLQKEIEERRQSFYNLADDLLNEKDKTPAKENISRVTPFVQGTIDDMLLHAISAHNKGDLEEAVETYSKILAAVSENDRNVIAVIRKHRGMAYFAMNKFDEALEDFEESIRFDPNAYRTYYYEGIVYSIMKKYETAVECFTKSIEINQFQGHTHFRRAMAYYELEEYEKSMSDLNSAINLGIKPEDCKVLQEKLVKKFGMQM